MLVKLLTEHQLELLSLFHANRTTVLPCDLPQASDSRQNSIPHVDFSLNVRHPYDSRTLVLCSRAVLSPDVLAGLQSYCKYGGRKVVRTS